MQRCTYCYKYILVGIIFISIILIFVATMKPTGWIKGNVQNNENGLHGLVLVMSYCLSVWECRSVWPSALGLLWIAGSSVSGLESRDQCHGRVGTRTIILLCCIHNLTLQYQYGTFENQTQPILEPISYRKR